MAEALLTRLDGVPWTCEHLTDILHKAVGSFDVVHGTERFWPQSQSAKVHVRFEGGAATTLFLKKVTPTGSNTKPLAARRREAFSNRCEARFYSEFVDVLRDRGVALLTAVHVEERLDWLDTPDDSGTGSGGGILLLLESADEHVQASPLTRSQAKCTLSSLATWHAACWQDQNLLQMAKQRLHAVGGWWTLEKRGEAEISAMADVWPRFLEAFGGVAAELTSRDEIVQLPARLARLAGWVARQLERTPTCEFATLLHGDYKAANIMLPAMLDDAAASAASAVPVDFQWVGVGLGMSDVAYHITHAVQIDELEVDGGEEDLVHHYLESIRAQLPTAAAAAYTDEIAMRHYRLAVLDYARLVLSRFVTDASPEAFATANAAPRAANIGVIYRDPRAPLRFVRRVDSLLAQLERECLSAGMPAELAIVDR